jgi:hypothetical protein
VHGIGIRLRCPRSGRLYFSRGINRIEQRPLSRNPLSEVMVRPILAQPVSPRSEKSRFNIRAPLLTARVSVPELSRVFKSLIKKDASSIECFLGLQRRQAKEVKKLVAANDGKSDRALSTQGKEKARTRRIGEYVRSLRMPFTRFSFLLLTSPNRRTYPPRPSRVLPERKNNCRRLLR